MVMGIYKLGLLITLGFAAGISALGQGRGFSSPMHGFSGPVAGTPRPGLAPGVRRGFVPPPLPLSVSQHFPPVNGVPGLGFDFPHLTIVGLGLPRRLGFGNRGSFSSFTPVFFGPPYYPFEAEVPYSEAGHESMNIVVPSQPLRVASPPVGTASGAASPQDPPPLPELAPLILACRDGRIVQVVAFTANNGRIVYIAMDRRKHSLPVSELDKNATRLMNAAYGTSVSLPN
jgi:hypothetical protein